MGIKIRKVSEILSDGEEIRTLAEEIIVDEGILLFAKPDDDSESIRLRIFLKKEKIEKLMKNFTQLDLLLLLMKYFKN